MAAQTLQLAAEYESANPFKGKTVTTFAETTDEQLEGKIAVAHMCPHHVAPQDVCRAYGRRVHNRRVATRESAAGRR